MLDHLYSIYPDNSIFLNVTSNIIVNWTIKLLWSDYKNPHNYNIGRGWKLLNSNLNEKLNKWIFE